MAGLCEGGNEPPGSLKASKIIAQVKNFKYLGAEITNNGELNKEVNYQIVKANTISGYLNDTMWRNRYLRRETKKKKKEKKKKKKEEEEEEEEEKKKR
ncbi:hypothetical protein ANN_01241 [Periplaneta americana]|uniref:Uncharacterized protein n=1 Tax=Periplaneta americana TaxID=6978 RepID=A0ABQ8TX29_PERAM|nr:hypothetical protein ANN_01241 [Periplaneta americana]